MDDSVVSTVRAAVHRFMLNLSPPTGGRVLVAVSGGQDSIVLLDSLEAVKTDLGINLGVVHVDHSLRGERSRAAAEAVAELARTYNLPYSLDVVDVGAYAAKHRLGLEEAGRLARYQVFAREAARQGAWAAATGHTSDDLAETLLINIIRGTGLSGLTSIHPTNLYTLSELGPPVSNAGEAGSTKRAPALFVVRPLLDVTREMTARYCRARGLEVHEDETNFDPIFLRNRVRHHLLPLLRTYNPSITLSLGRLAQLTADDERELEQLTETAWASYADEEGGEIRFDWNDWSGLSPALQRRLLRRARREIGAGDAWSFQSLESARELLAGRPARRSLDLGGGIRLTTARKGFRLYQAARSPKSESEV